MGFFSKNTYAGTILFEKIKAEIGSATADLWRAKVPGGWILMIHSGDIGPFIPDPEHKWFAAEKI